ncbi:MAG: intermembrane phospholipid transport protein YdbH family protein [Alphaproteobacteria bacterium]
MRKYTVFIVVVALLVFTGTILYGYFKYIPERIEHTVLTSIRSIGFQNLQVGKIEKHRGVVRFLDISLDKESFSTVKEVRVSFSPLNILFNPDRASKIHIKGITLTGDFADHLSIAGWNVDASHNFLKQPLHSFPAKTITIEDSRLDLLTDAVGGLGIYYNAQLRLNNDHISIRGEAKSKQKRVSYQSKIDGVIQQDGTININAEAEQLSFKYKDIHIRRGASKVQATYDPTQNTTVFSAESHMASVMWHGIPLREVHSVFDKGGNTYNLTAEGKTFGNQQIEWNTRVNSINDVTKSETTLQPDSIESLLLFLKANKKLRTDTYFPPAVLNIESPALSVNTIHENAALKGDFTILVDTPSFEIEGYFSSPEGDISTIDGVVSIESEMVSTSKETGDKTRFTLSSSGEFAIGALSEQAILKWSAKNNIKRGTLDYGPIQINNLKGDITLGSNKKGKKRETLSFRLPLKKGIPQRGKVSLNIRDKHASLFEQIVFYIYGGQIKTRNRLFKDGALLKTNKLIVSDINLDQLFDDAGFHNILISGTLGGVVPFHAKNNKIMVNGGILQSQSSGVIQLPDNVISALFPGNTRKMHLIRGALKNYYYEFFEIRLDGDLSGRVLMTLKASGFNPNFNNREPVDLSLQIETQISILFRNLLE